MLWPRLSRRFFIRSTHSSETFESFLPCFSRFRSFFIFFSSFLARFFAFFFSFFANFSAVMSVSLERASEMQIISGPSSSLSADLGFSVDLSSTISRSESESSFCFKAVPLGSGLGSGLSSKNGLQNRFYRNLSSTNLRVITKNIS